MFDYGILLIVAFHQNRIERGNAAPRKIAHPLHKMGKQVQNRRRVPFGRRRLTGSQADFTLGHGKPCKGVNNQKHVSAQACEVFRHGGRCKRRTQSQ